MDFVKEILSYLGSRKKLWLIPLFTLFFVFGALFVVSQGSVVAPFIYTLF